MLLPVEALVPRSCQCVDLDDHQLLERLDVGHAEVQILQIVQLRADDKNEVGVLQLLPLVTEQAGSNPRRAKDLLQ